VARLGLAGCRIVIAIGTLMIDYRTRRAGMTRAGTPVTNYCKPRQLQPSSNIRLSHS